MLIASSGCRTAATNTVGSFISEKFILTVAHGVAGQTTNEVTTLNGTKFLAKTVAIDTEQDLALLRVDALPSDSEIEPLDLGIAKAGQTVSFVAFSEQNQFVKTAKIRRRLKINTRDIYLKEKVSRPGLEVDLKVAVGNSGGPLINESGELVGIVWSTSRLVDNRSWATRTDEMSRLIETANSNPSTQTSKVVACTR